jgi:serine/threonine protein kinase
MKYLTGTMLGPYAILERIGGGGMATVYKAYQPSVDRFVALKVVRVDIAEQPEFRERFDREARTIARLEHRYILPIYDFGESEGIPYLVMRYTDGGTLSDVIASGPLPPQRAIRYIGQVAEALAYTHARDIIHRDIKPANILLSPDDHVLLTDFGIAKMVAGTTALTAAGMALGTPFYMAPEQVRSQPIDARTDIYALGIVLYECLVGRPPFVAETPWAVLDMHVRDPLPSPRAANPAIDAALEQAILKATNKKPEDRFGSADEFAAALHAIPEALPAPTPALRPTPAAIPHTLVLPEDEQPAGPAAVASPSSPSVPQPVPPAGVPAAAPPVPAPLPTAASAAVAPLDDPDAMAQPLSSGTPQPPAEPVSGAPRQEKRRSIPRWVWAGLGLVAVALVGAALFGSRLFAPSPEPLFASSFANGRADDWQPENPAYWTVVKDADGEFVYQGSSHTGAIQRTAPIDTNTVALQQLSDYAVELRARVVQPGTPDDPYADFWIGIRLTPKSMYLGGCQMYIFNLDATVHDAEIGRFGNAGCRDDWTLLAGKSFPLAPNIWHTIRAEVVGTHLRLVIDGETILEGDDSTLHEGSFYLATGPGAIVQFADIRVVPAT